MNGVEKRRVQIWLLLVLAATLLVSCAISLRFDVLQETLDVTPVRIIAAGEHAYTFEFEPTRLSHRLFGRQGDSNETPQRSRLRLLENDVAIGRPHSAHEEILVAGGGRFSHWQSAPIARSPDALIFSTSDNSDPRSNGRSYRVSYPLEFGALGLTVVALLWLASIAGFSCVSYGPTSLAAVTTISNTLLTLMSRAVHTHLWTVIVAGVSLYVVWFFSFAMPSVPLLFSDSYTYSVGQLRRLCRSAI